MAKKKSALPPAKKSGPEYVKVTALNDEQRAFLKAINDNDVTFVNGAAGTGKTFTAVGYGVTAFMHGKYDRLIFTRPCVEAYGESLGYLPGDANAKLAPYMLPMIEAMSQFVELEVIKALVEDGRLMTIPFAHLRGLTFRKAFVIADECQNTVPQQMRLFLTRLGEGTKAVVTGDLSQPDRSEEENGLAYAMSKLDGVEGIATVHLSRASIVRSKIVARIEERFSEAD